MNSQSQDNHEISQKLYNKAIELLARREHSQAELAAKLKMKFRDADCIDDIISVLFERLVQSGYQSDQRFSENYARARISMGFGRKRIAMELSQKGVSSELIRDALDEVFESAQLDEMEQLKSLWVKKFGQKPEDPKARAKQMRFLVGRGYSFEQIQRLFD